MFLVLHMGVYFGDFCPFFFRVKVGEMIELYMCGYYIFRLSNAIRLTTQNSIISFHAKLKLDVKSQMSCTLLKIEDKNIKTS